MNKILLSQDWFVSSDAGFDRRHDVQNVIYCLIDGKPHFQCDDREVLENNYQDFWNNFVVPFENGEIIITASGYFYFPDKHEIHILLPGYMSVTKTKNNPDDEMWVREELKRNRHGLELPLK